MRANKITLTIMLLLLSTWAFAGNTGKIAGYVKDKQTGEPLIGANVMIKGTHFGAAADINGNYYILQVPPGKYELRVTYIGYHKMVVQNVDVRVDLTTRINFELESQAIEMPTLTVVAEEALVQQDITSTRKITTRKEIEDTPGFENTSDIFMMHGGTIVDAAPQTLTLQGEQLQVRDNSVKNVHVRGGRGGEILFIVDGVPVTHPIYGGRDVLDLNVVDIQGMELLTGAFNAEYGQAQSGVVNITTRTGGEQFKGGVQYKTSELGDFYRTQYTSLYLGGPEPLITNFLPTLGLKIPGKTSFFLSANGSLSDTPYDNNRNRDTVSLFGLNIKERQNNSGNLNAKINWNLSDQFALIFSYHGSWKTWSNFEWLWKNYPNNMANYSRNNQNFNFRINHTLSKSTFYNINFSYLSVDYDGSLNGNSPADFWTFYKNGIGYDYWNYKNNFPNETPDSLESKIKAPTTDSYGFIDNQSHESIWRDDFTKTFTFKGDITSQIHPEHLIKTGFEIQYNDIQYVDIQDGGVKLSNYGSYVFNNDPYFPAPNGEYKEFGQNRWVFDAYPLSGGLYLQDKFEKETLIINAGIRADWFVPGPTIKSSSWKNQWENATGLKADWGWLKYKFSPRFGISFPITEKTVIFFSYGHFNQLPELQYFYRDPYTGGFTGNPHLDYEQTILYEFGFTHQLANNWALDIKSYTKDISKQVETLRLEAALGLPVYLYDNQGYGRARGLEFELVKRYSNFTSGKVTYTVQWANGYSSSAFDNYVRSKTDFPYPIRERALNWDIRHQVVLQAILTSPKNKNINLFGLKLPDDWTITVLSRFSSGQPYTPYTLDPAVAQKTENSATGPYTMATDLKLKKTFNVSGVDVSIFADIFNLFNQKNVQIGYGFNTLTGKPYRYGDVDPQLTFIDKQQYISWHEMYKRMDPRQFAAGRYAKIGMMIDW